MRRSVRWVIATALVVVMTALPGAAGGAAPRTSLTEVEADVMCVSCREPLAVAQSPQAIAERRYISELVQQGLTKSLIEQRLVAQYGTAVLGRPPARGVGLLIYIVPPALVLLALGLLALVLPRWRRRARAAAREPQPEIPPISPDEADRLRRDLAQADA